MEPHVVVGLWTLIAVIAGAAVAAIAAAAAIGKFVVWHLEKHFEALDKRIDEVKEDTNKRIDELKENINELIDELKEGLKKQNEGVMSNEQRDRPSAYPDAGFDAQKNRPHALPTKEQEHSAPTGTNPTEPRNSESNEIDR